MPVSASGSPSAHATDHGSRRAGRPPGFGDARHGCPAPQDPPGLCPESDDEILVVGYLSAVAAALDERGIAVTTLHLDGRLVHGHREALCGTLTLRPAAIGRVQGSWGPTQADWHQDTGWSARLRRGINGHLTIWRYLHAAPVPAPTAVAGFLAALAAGADIGMACPARLPGRRDTVRTRLARFAAREPW